MDDTMQYTMLYGMVPGSCMPSVAYIARLERRYGPPDHLGNGWEKALFVMHVSCNDPSLPFPLSVSHTHTHPVSFSFPYISIITLYSIPFKERRYEPASHV